jgi:hypothetical protein
MDRRTIGARLAVVPLGHKIAAISGAIAITAASIAFSSMSPRRYKSSAVLSYDLSQTKALTTDEHRSARSQAVALAQSILSDDVLTALVSASETSSQPPTAQQIASLRSHLAISEMSNSRLRLVWTGKDPAHTKAVTQSLTSVLVSWSPPESTEMYLASDTRTPLAENSTKQHQTEPPIDSERAQQIREKALLQITIAVLDSKSNNLEADLKLIGNDRHAAANTPAHLETESSKRLSNLGQTSLGQVKSAALAATKDAAEDDQTRRDRIQKQIAAIRNQRMLLTKRLDEAQHQEAQLRTPALPSEPSARELKTVPDSKTGTSKHTLISQRIDTLNKPFVLLEPVSAARASGDLNSLTEPLGIIAGLLFGLFYLAAALWRFRPIHDAAILMELLPEHVLFVGSISEIGQ